jgi:hypothetical protein
MTMMINVFSRSCIKPSFTGNFTHIMKYTSTILKPEVKQWFKRRSTRETLVMGGGEEGEKKRKI